MNNPVGHILDALGVTREPEDDELIDSALVILHTVKADGREGVALTWSDGMSWVARRGLIEIALDSERTPPVPNDDEDDE